MQTDHSGLSPLRCPRCGYRADGGDPDFYRGCPDCRAAGRAVNLACELDQDRVAAALRRPPGRVGLWWWADALPVPERFAVTLGEGGTPLLPLGRLGTELGVPGLLVKNESANPTWSHKDRLAALAVAAARALGADTVTAASTGNHGAAVAAYAARAGLRCVVFTTGRVPETMKTLMRAYGAELTEVEDSAQRYEPMAEGIHRHGWYPASNAVRPPVGSNPHGVDGYKTLAYELWADLGGRAPHTVLIPVSGGDLMAGVYRGFADLLRAGRIEAIPRLVGAEVTAALGRGLDTTDGRYPAVPTGPTAAFSIATAITTDQAVRAVRATGGRAVTVTEREMLDVQRRLATTEGLFAEASSCVPIAAAAAIAAETPPGATVVAVLTSTGLKDPRPG